MEIQKIRYSHNIYFTISPGLGEPFIATAVKETGRREDVVLSLSGEGYEELKERMFKLLDSRKGF